MTGVAIWPGETFMDAYLSDESSRQTAEIRRLSEVGREGGLSTSLTEAEPPVATDKLAKRFETLAEAWRKECAHLSSVREMVLHPAYQQIIGMGKDAVPFLLRELERQPDHWFWALWAITQENPVHPEHQGQVREMARDWLEWARRKGIEW